MKEGLIGCFLALILWAVISIFEGWIVMLLWNWLAPIIWTSAPIFTIWETIGILFLINIISKIIFGSKSK